MFMSRNKKNNVYPCKLQFYYIKEGFKGVKIIQACFRDEDTFFFPFWLDPRAHPTLIAPIYIPVNRAHIKDLSSLPDYEVILCVPKWGPIRGNSYN